MANYKYRVEFDGIGCHYTPHVWRGSVSHHRLTEYVWALAPDGDILRARIVRQATGEVVESWETPALSVGPFLAAW